MTVSSKYADKQEQALHALCLDEWSNASGGDVESPPGYHWLLLNGPETQTELEDYALGMDADERVPAGMLLGFFVLVEDSQGFVNATRYSTEHAARLAYDALAVAYSRWADADEDEA